MNKFYNSHTRLEKILHNLAFKQWYPCIALSNIESLIYKSQLDGISVEKPVFITALPRAGTTLLLKLCVETNEFASHQYRDMPFLFSPFLWNRFSKNFRDSGSLNERVHGDGILVNLDSPESFEEILWKEFWPSHYKKNRIVPWTKNSYLEFEDFFIEHMRKIILLHGKDENQVRYISKNNLNIARIGYLSNTFPDSTIIILFRSPLQQAASLLRQHRNFIKIHKKDPFARKYMEDTGHFDFGENLRPVDFNGWFSKADYPNPNRLSFWLEYWINTYRYLLQEKNDQVKFFSFESLCKDPKTSFKKLSGIIEVKNIEGLMKSVDQIRIPKPHEFDTKNISQKILDQAKEMFKELLKAGSV